MNLSSRQETRLLGRAGTLLASLVRQPWGQMSPSVYETARLVPLGPGLRGDQDRIAYLLAVQRADGGWGTGDPYRLVPTLSATDAILSALRRTDQHDGDGMLAAAASRGLTALTTWLR